MKLSFIPDPKLCLADLDRIKKRIFSEPYIVEAVKKAHEYGIGPDAQLYLQESQRDPAATPQGSGEHEKKIKEAITSGAGRAGSIEVYGWTGNVNRLDRIVTTTNVSSPGVPLWSVLEYGAVKHRIEAYNFWFLRFFWYRIGKWISTPSVEHPGQRGRFYFAKAAKNSPMWYDRFVKTTFYRMFNGS